MLLFLVPVSIVLVPLFGLIYSREILVDCRQVITANGRYVFGLAYSEVGRQFKFSNVVERSRFDVIAIGSSRVLPFRSDMFTKSFYNAGRVTQSIAEYQQFLEAIPKDKLPKIIVVGLDQWMFNSNYQKEYDLRPAESNWSDLSAINSNVGKKVKMIVEDYRAGKIKYLFRKSGYELYGISAKVDSSGYRNDGSYLYSSMAKKLRLRDSTFYDFEFRSTLEHIRKGCCRFNFGRTIDSASVVHLDALLSFCKRNNIQVVAFLPPFATSVFHELAGSANYAYMGQIYERIEPLFEKHGYELFDFSNPAIEGQSIDDEMIDGYHSGERLFLRILLEMLKRESILNGVADVHRLEDDLRKAKDRFVVYDY